jgi:phosphoglycolate phosphatase
MRYAAALFDLDGTLVDSLEDIGRSVNHALGLLGLPGHPLGAYRGFVGEGVRHLLVRAAPAGTGPSALEALLGHYQAHYQAHLLAHTRPYPGVVEVLAACAARGQRLAVLSNKGHAFTGALVRGLLPGVPFAEVWGERPERFPRKPDPAAALALARELGVAPAACAFVGDTAVDVRTALAAGMTAVGVTWGFRPEEVRAEAGVVVEDAAALARVLLAD